jgi:hypothetical protein
MKNQRLSRRRAARAAAMSIDVYGAGAVPLEMDAALVDASLFGVRLQLPAQLAAGSAIRIRLELASLAGPLFYSGTVVWSALQPDGCHHAGIHFEESLPYRILRELDAPEPPVGINDPPATTAG